MIRLTQLVSSFSLNLLIFCLLLSRLTPILCKSRTHFLVATQGVREQNKPNCAMKMLGENSFSCIAIWVPNLQNPHPHGEFF